MSISIVSLSMCPLNKEALTILQIDLPTIFQYILQKLAWRPSGPDTLRLLFKSKFNNFF